MARPYPEAEDADFYSDEEDEGYSSGGDEEEEEIPVEFSPSMGQSPFSSDINSIPSGNITTPGSSSPSGAQSRNQRLRGRGSQSGDRSSIIEDLREKWRTRDKNLTEFMGETRRTIADWTSRLEATRSQGAGLSNEISALKRDAYHVFRRNKAKWTRFEKDVSACYSTLGDRLERSEERVGQLEKTNYKLHGDIDALSERIYQLERKDAERTKKSEESWWRSRLGF